MCDDTNSLFQAKKQYLYTKIWKFGANGSKFIVENVIFGIADPDLPITMQRLRATMMTNNNNNS